MLWTARVILVWTQRAAGGLRQNYAVCDDDLESDFGALRNPLIPEWFKERRGEDWGRVK